MKDPKRLTADDELAELAPDLLAAVRMLREELPDPAVVARTQRVLETLPPPRSSTGKLGFNLLAGLGAVVLSASAVVFVTRQAPERQPDPPPAAITKSAPAIDSSATHAAPADPSPRLQSQEAPAPAPRVESPPPPRPVRRSASVKNKLVPASSGSAAPPPMAAAVVTNLEARPRPESSEAPRTAVTPAAVPSRVPDAISEPKGPEPTDEAGLLFRAKRLAVRDPAGALRLLDSHAFYFPHGAFVEEREILAIDLLSRIGQSDRARERAARFRVRFPNSVYRSADVP